MVKVVEFTGVVREVIEAINLAYAHGWLVSVVASIELTQDEMDEFMSAQPFTGNVGKFYGDDDVGSLMDIVTNMQTGKVTSFWLRGVPVVVRTP